MLRRLLRRNKLDRNSKETNGADPDNVLPRILPAELLFRQPRRIGLRPSYLWEEMDWTGTRRVLNPSCSANEMTTPNAVVLRRHLCHQSVMGLPQKLVHLIIRAPLLIACGCSHKSNEDQAMNPLEIESKLNIVLQQMIGHSEDAGDREELRAAELFQKIQDLPMNIVGISVPINGGSNTAHISFSLDHFQRTAPDVLAAEGMEDLQTAKASSRGDRNDQQMGL